MANKAAAPTLDPNSGKPVAWFTIGGKSADNRLLKPMSLQAIVNELAKFEQRSNGVSSLSILAEVDQATHDDLLGRVKLPNSFPPRIKNVVPLLSRLSLALKVPIGPLYARPLGALIGSKNNLVELKLAVSHTYSFGDLQFPCLKTLKLVSSWILTAGSIPSKDTLKSAGGSIWRAFINFLAKLENLESLCLEGVLPDTAGQHLPPNTKVELPRLSRVDLYDEAEACLVLCQYLSFPRPRPLHSLLNLRLTHSNPQALFRFTDVEPLVALVTGSGVKAVVRGLKVNWAPTHRTGSADFTTSSKCEWEHKESSQLYTFKVQLTSEYSQFTNGWLRCQLVERIPVSELRSLSLSDPGISQQEIYTIISRARAVEKLKLRGSETCWMACAALRDGTKNALQALANGLRSDHGAVYSTQGFPTFSMLLLRVQTLVLIDVDFTFLPHRDSPLGRQFPEGKANHLRANTGRIMNVVELLCAILSARERLFEGQSPRPLQILINGPVSGEQLHKLNSFARPGVVQVGTGITWQG